MITLLLSIIKIVILVICFLVAVLFIVLAIVWRKKKTAFTVYVSLSVVFILAIFLLWSTNFVGGETTDRTKAAAAFEENFGFEPPDVIEEIKLKNYSMYDASAHWMAFTYDSTVFHRILAHDQPLDTAFTGTPKYDGINLSLEQGCANCPDWLELPNANTPRIFLKKDFLDHSSSEYYLWVNTKTNTVYLEVSYFD